jgi:hypothetical protein
MYRLHDRSSFHVAFFSGTVRCAKPLAMASLHQSQTDR